MAFDRDDCALDFSRKVSGFDCPETDPELASRQCSCLIDEDLADLRELLERFGTFHEYPITSKFSDRHAHREWRGECECTRARDQGKRERLVESGVPSAMKTKQENPDDQRE